MAPRKRGPYRPGRTIAFLTLYVLRCRDGSLYTGVASDLPARVAQHNRGAGAKYTRSRRPVEVAWSRPRLTATRARRLEYAIKQLDRADKLRLVGGDDAVWRRLLRELRRQGVMRLR